MADDFEYLGICPEFSVQNLLDYAEDLPPDRKALLLELLRELDCLVVADCHPEAADRKVLAVAEHP